MENGYHHRNELVFVLRCVENRAYLLFAVTSELRLVSEQKCCQIPVAWNRFPSHCAHCLHVGRPDPWSAYVRAHTSRMLSMLSSGQCR